MSPSPAKERVLIVANGHPDFSKGGAEMVAYGQFKELESRHDCEAMFLAALPNGPIDSGTCLSSRRPNELLLSTASGDFFKFSQPYKPAIVWHFRELLELFRPTVVHFHHYVHLGIEILREAHNHDPDMPIVLTLHEFLAICHQNGQMVKRDSHKLCRESNPMDCHTCYPERSTSDFFLRKLYIQSFFEVVDQFVSPSEFLLERYVDWGIPREKIRFMENGLAGMDEADESPPSPPSRTAARTEGDAADAPAGASKQGGPLLRTRPVRAARHLEPTRIGFFGQINPFKGLDVLLEAIVLMRRSTRTRLSVAINGSSPEQQPPAFQEKITQLLDQTRDCVELKGPYELHDLADRMARIDWVIVPSIWWENSPVVIQEAYRFGHPVICSDIGGMKEKVIDGVTGLHFKAQNPESLAAILESIAEGEVTPQDFHPNLPRPVSFTKFADQNLEMYRALRTSIRNRNSSLGRKGFPRSASISAN